MSEYLKAWLHQSVIDAMLSPAGVKVVGLLSAMGNLALWIQDNLNLIAAVSGILIPWLLYRASIKKTQLEMKILRQQEELNQLKIAQAKEADNVN